VEDQALTLTAGARLVQDEPGRYTLTLGEDGDRFRLDDAALALVDLFDGLRTLPEVAEAARRRGLSAPLPAIQGFAAALRDAGLLVPSAELPLEAAPDARVTCTRCGHCCHLPVGPLTAESAASLRALDWGDEEAPEQPLAGDGAAWLAQTEEGACVFLEEDGRCQIHRRFGAQAKPDPCRLFPLAPVRRAGRVLVAPNYECPGMAAALREGVSVADEAAELEPIIRRSYSGYPVLLEGDTGGHLARAAGGATTPEAALTDLAAVALGLLEEGTLGFAALLNDTERIARHARDAAPNTYLRRQQDAALAALCDERAGTAAPAVSHPADRAPVSDLYLGWLRGQVFLGEPMGRLGVGAGLSVLALTYLVARRLAKLEAREAARSEVSDEDAAAGLSLALGSISALDGIDEIDGAGGRCLREALARL